MGFSKKVFMAFYSEYGMSPQQMSARLKESKKEMSSAETDGYCFTKKKSEINGLELQSISVQK
jgi:hypothetical protein